jgi:alginate O-acetyltransferase complex protein AlgI
VSFQSVQFLFFFPIILILYFILPNKLRNAWLLLVSYYFYYCWGSVVYVVILAGITLLTYGAGFLVQNSKGRKRKLWATLAICITAAVLLVCKYNSFIIQNINTVLKLIGNFQQLSLLSIVLPIGISFYTLQGIGYVVDVYKGKVPVQKNLLNYALFMSFFPQQTSGPIARAGKLLPQFEAARKLDVDNLRRGFGLMLWGFFQKLVIADMLAILVNQVYGNYSAYKGLELFIASICYSLQLYTDFAGYTDIARGAACTLGINLSPNFDRPYGTRSIGEFWRRWHISFSSWLRDYIYIPLGGNRKGRARKYLNIMITFLVSGIWHGASWNFVAWGMLHGGYQVVGQATSPVREKFWKFIQVNKDSPVHHNIQKVFTFLLVTFAWVLFRAPGLSAGLEILRNMFSSFNPWILVDGGLFSLGLSAKQMFALLLALLVFYLVGKRRSQGGFYEYIREQHIVVRWAIYLGCLFIILIYGAYGAGFNAAQFIYVGF